MNLKAKRPDYKPERESIDLVFEILGIMGLLLLFGYPLFSYGSLPEQIPTHFNASGQPDDFSAKWTVWILPAAGLAMYLLFHGIKQIPDKYNYPVKITTENAAFQYKNAVRMMTFFQASIVVSMAYITLITIQTALGNAEGLGTYFVQLFLLIFIGGGIYFTWQSAVKK